MEIGILGGTFNPPHLGHAHAGRAAQRQLGLDALLLIPAGVPPHKPLPEGSATPAQRLDMTRLLADDIPGAQVLDIELRREGPSYTVDTLSQLKARYPQDRLWLIVGSDMLLSFDKWWQPEVILQCCGLAAVSRTAGDRPRLSAQAEALRARYGAQVVLVDAQPVEVSSTDLRKGELSSPSELSSPGQGAPLLPPAVARYVVQQGLYGDAVQLAAMAQLASAAMSPHRLRHTLGVEAMAARLAAAHGVDPVSARKAALLHDIAKERPLEQQLQLLEKHGIMPNYPNETLGAVLHADSGAVIAQAELGQPDDICDAIRYHTTGRPGMTALEKVIYVADKIEENRTYGDLPAIRAIAERDLDGAVRAVLRGCLLALERQGTIPFERSVQALAYYDEKSLG